MASSSRKKQDEKNLKTLRELGSLPQNKYCFDCNQRGPTYVNTTIGSFVCTKCSGMLRGLTPPHRVKSISMATFTPEEIDLLKNRGNDYCKSVWLGLCDGVIPSANTGGGGDEQHIRDFMFDKYEKKRYYLDPAQALRNGYATSTSSSSSVPLSESTKIKPLTNLVSDPKSIKINGTNNNIKQQINNNNKLNTPPMDINRKRPDVKQNNNNNNQNFGAGFAVNFDNADIFTSNNQTEMKCRNGFNNTTNNTNNGISTKTNGINGQESFANFDDVFKSNKSNSNASMPVASNAFDNFNLAQMNSINNKVNTTLSTSSSGIQQPVVNASSRPVEDKYAALKDLDNALKTQNGVDWNSSGSNGSLYSSPTPTGSMYSSPSPQSSMFGSPSQGHFLNAFQLNQENNTFSNPFNNNVNVVTTNGGGGTNGMNNWTNSNNFAGNNQAFANPFRDLNGFATSAAGAPPTHHGFQSVFPSNGMVVGGMNPWTAPNPFKVGAAAGNTINSNNPFL